MCSRLSGSPDRTRSARADRHGEPPSPLTSGNFESVRTDTVARSFVRKEVNGRLHHIGIGIGRMKRPDNLTWVQQTPN